MTANVPNPHPVILELVGPAGAGKTTIRNTLLSNYPQVQFQVHPYFRDRKNAPFFITNTLKMLPLLARIALTRAGRHLTLQEIALMVIMHGWSPLLKRRAAQHHGFTLLDQGPVYLMAHLDPQGPPRLHTPAAVAWINHGYQVWANTVNTIIYVDTEDSILIERINTRGKGHGVRGKPEDEARKFLIRSRESLNYAICALHKRNNNLRIYRFNSSEKSADEISQEVVTLVNHSL